MKKNILFIILFTIINCANLFSSLNINLTSKETNYLQSNYIFNSVIPINNDFSDITLNQTQNSLFSLNNLDLNKIDKNDSEIKIETDSIHSIHLFQSEFMYADNPLYTITGELPLRETKIKPLNMGIIGAVYATAFVLQHKIQMNTIWKEQTDFKIQEDGNYALYVDKVGHFYGTWVMSHFLRETFLWTGFNYKTSYWLGAVAGLAYSTYVEVLDGYGKNWGFSPSDFYFDMLGTSFSIAQYYIPVLQNFTPKFSYIPSTWFGERERIPSEIMIDDYSSQVFWLSINVNNLLGANLKKYWPSWLQLSIGYTARNLCDPDYPEFNKYQYDYNGVNVKGDPKYILALDVDFVKLLPGDGKFWNWIKQSLNVLKFPSPAIEFSKNRTKFYLLYPFNF